MTKVEGGGGGGWGGGLAPVNRWCTRGNRTKCYLKPPYSSSRETFSHKDSDYRLLETIRRTRKVHPNLKVA